MASKNNDRPHLRDWMRNFSKSAVTSTKKILGESMPNLKTTKDSVNSIAANTRTFITRTKTGMNMQSRSLASTTLGRNATEIIRDALNDMKTGNFSLEKSAEFSLDFDDDSYYEIGDGLDLSNPEDFAANEERKNAAKIGKAISRTSAASIEGMRAMTHTISQVTIKSQEASTAKLLNANLFGFNQINTQMNEINTHLYNVNQNLAAMIRFQNENVSATNQAALEYYQSSSEMLSKMGENIAELVDYKNRLSKTDNTKDRDYFSDSEFDLRSGFDLREYGKLVKKNFKNNPMVQMVSMFGSMASMGGGIKEMFRPTEMLMEAIIKKTILPKKTRKSLGRLDTMANNVIQNLLYRLGDMGEDYSQGMFANLIGNIFGVKRAKVGSVNLGDFKKDAMSWNGKSQQALVEVIPSYLSNIEAAVDALNQKLGVPGRSYNRRYYDMDNGIFKSEKTLKKEMEDNYKNAIEYTMNEISSKIEKAISKSSGSDAEKELTRKEINDLINLRIKGDMTNNRQYSSQMKRLLSQGADMSTREIGSVMMDLENAIMNSVKEINEFNKKIESELSGSVYRNVLNNGQKISSFQKEANIFSNREWLNGIDLSSLNSDEAENLRRQQENSNRMNNAKKGFFERIKRMFGAGSGNRYDTFMSNNIDRMNDALFESYLYMSEAMDNPSDIPRDIRNGVRTRYQRWRTSRATNQSTPNPAGQSSSNTQQTASQQSSLRRLTDRATTNRDGLNVNSASVRLSRRLQHTIQGTLDQTMNASSRQIDHDMSNSSAIVETTLDSVNDMDPLTANVLTMKGFVSDIHNKFLKPMSSKIFGKDGLIQNLYKNPMIEKGINFLKDKLFNEKDGLLAPAVSYFKDGINYIKYEITGKEYTDRNGRKYPKKKENTVLSHLRNAYDFVFSNTMKYIFGDDYKNNKVFNDIFKRFDWKAKKEEKDKREEAQEKNKRLQSARKRYLTDSTKTNVTAKDGRKVTSAKFNNKIKPNSNVNDENVDGSNAIVSQSSIKQNIQQTVTATTDRISTAGKKFSQAVFGNDGENNERDFLTEIHQENKKAMGKLKHKFPKMLAGAAIGAGTVALSGGSMGLLGGLFLPSSLIGGATLGIATTLLSENEKFKKFIFGEEDENGVKKNGLISDKMQKAFKKSLPLIVGGATLGALKNVFLGSSMGNSAGGVLLSSFLPGGVVGGAILGTGLTLMKNNETINHILFGKNPDDEKGKTGTLTKGLNKISSFLGGSKKFIMGGLKGLGAGVLTGAAVSHMGLLGSAVTMGGPIGMALAGMSVGIASQTRRFQELLFGTEEFDENGNPTGKRNKDGILTQARNLLVLNVFEPIKNKLEDNAVDFAYWAKDNLLYPFETAFGPILDSITQIKDDVSDFLKDKFEALSTSIGEAIKGTMKKVFSPFTSLLGKIGGFALKAVTKSAQLALMPVSIPLRTISMLTAFARGKEYASFTGSFIKNAVPGLKDKWDNETTDYGAGPMGMFRKIKSRVSDIGTAYTEGREAYNQTMAANGYNHFNWRGVPSERSKDKKELAEIRKQRRQRAKIDRLAKKYAKEDRYKQNANWTESKFKRRQKELSKKAGVNIDGLQTIEDIQDLMYNRSAWNQKYDPATIAKNEAKINARDDKFQAETRDYQNQVKSDFAKIIQLMTEEAEERAAKKRQQTADKRYRKQLGKMKKNMKKAGIDPKELERNGVNFADYVGYMDIPQSMWEEYMESPEYEKGDLDGWINKNINRIYEYDEDKVQKYKKFRRNKNHRNLKAKFRRNSSSTNNTTESNNEAQINNEPNSDTIVAEQLSLTNSLLSGGAYDDDKFWRNITPGKKRVVKSVISKRQLDEAHISESEQADNQKKSAKVMANSLLSSIMQKKRAEKAKEKEEEETKKARSLGNKSSQSNENENNEAKIEDLNDGNDSEAEKEKKGLISTLLGGTNNLLSGVFNWLGNGKTWQKFGVGLAIATLFSDQIKESKIIPKIGDFIADNFDTAANFLADNIPKLLNGFTTFITDYGPQIISTTADTISTLMPDLLTATFTIAKSVITSVGGEILEKLGIKTDEKVIDNVEEAQALLNEGINLQDNGDGTYSQLGERTIIDEEGNVSTVSNSNIIETAVKHPKRAYQLGKGMFKAASYIPNKVVKTGAKAVSKAVNLTETGIKKVAKTVSKKTATTVAEKGTKEAIVSVGNKKIAKATLKVTAKNTVQSGAKNQAQKWFSKILVKMQDLTKNSKILKLVDGSVIGSAIKKLTPIISKAVAKLSDTSLAKKIIPKITAGVAEAGGKGGSKFIPLVGQALVIYDATSGFFEAANLFDVSSDEVDFGMRTISSVMKTILGLGIGPLFDLALEILSEILGEDYKKNFATWLYCAFMNFIGDTEAVDRLNANQDLFEQETANYNLANGTNLSTKAYSDLKNAPWWKKIFGNREDFSKYEVGNFDASKYTTNSSVSTTTNTTTATGYGSSKVTTKSSSHKTSAVGYGSSQKDPRWANYPIGTFSDGSVSTMATGGCGPTALSMVANNLSGKNTNPLAVAKFAKSNGYISEGGANEQLFTDGASKLGLHSSKVSSGSLIHALKSGDTMIVAGKSNSGDSPYTSAGHILAVKGASNGNALVSDPETGNTTEMSTSKLKSGMTHGWTYKKTSVGYGSAAPAATPAPLQAPTTQKKTTSNSNLKPTAGPSPTAIEDKEKRLANSIWTYQSVDDILSFRKKTGTQGKDLGPKTVSAVDKISQIFDTVRNIGKTKSKAEKNKSSNLSSLYTEGEMMTDTETTIGSYIIPAGTINWENPSFYVGKFYSDIKRLKKEYPALMKYSMFNVVYGNLDNFKAAGGSNKITQENIESLFGQYSTRTQLYDGINGLSNESAKYIKYKNGAVFYQQTNDSWSGIPWRSSNVGKKGDDLTSIAMILSTYSNNALTPNYIYENWLTNQPTWYDEEKGLTKQAFANGGLNGMLETRTSGSSERLKISSNKNPSSIENALKNRKLVYMKGYQYTDSIFGGTGEKTAVDPDKSPTHTVVGTFVNNDVIAVNDPSTGVNSFSLFPVSRLSDTVGKDTSVIKEAYIVSNPDGTGVSANIDVNSMKLPESKYNDPSKADTWLGKTTAVVGNVISVIENLIESVVTGNAYESIFTEKFDDSVSTGYDNGEQTPEALITTDTESETQTGTVVKRNSNDSTSSSSSGTGSHGGGSFGSSNDSTTLKPTPGPSPTANEDKKENSVSAVKKISDIFNVVKKTAKNSKSTKSKSNKNSSSNKKKTTTTSNKPAPLQAPKKPNTTSAVKKISSIFDIVKSTAKSKKKVGNGIGYGYVNPFLKYLFGIDGSSDSSATIDDGVIPSGTETVTAGDWIGKYVEQNESGTHGSSMVSSGAGDAGGVSFGTYQFPSYGKAKAESSSELYKFWTKYYGNSHPDVVPGNNTAFIDAWKSEARSNPDQFHSNEHSYVGSKYYVPQKNQLRGILDPDSHSRSAQEMVWSSSVQYGPNTSVIKKALNSDNSQTMGVKALVNKVQDYKVNSVGSYFSNSSAAVQAGVTNRHNVTERNILLGIADKAPLSGIGGGSSNITVGYGNPSKTLEAITSGYSSVATAMSAAALNGKKYKAGDYKEYMQSTSTDDSSSTTVSTTSTSNSTSSGSDVTVELPAAFNLASGSKRDFVSKILGGTMKHSIAYNLLPSITLAQAALESGWGKSGLSVKGKNLFGIKAGSSWSGDVINMPTTEYYNGKKTTVNAPFRKYNSYADSILDHAKLLMNSRYAKVKSATNYKVATQALKDAGYATDPSYPSLLNGIIESNDFAYFDRSEVIDSYRSKVAGYGKGRAGIIINHNGDAIGYGSADAARNAVVAVMKSLEGQLEYSQTNRNPEKGSGDCSSTVQYCYKNAVNIDPGSNSRAQASNTNGILVDKGTGNGPNIANLKPGDLLFYGASHNGTVSHVEMYVGNGMIMGHGGGSTGRVKGPSYHTASSYRTRGYISARRFIKDGTDVSINSSVGSSSETTTSATTNSALSPLSNIMSKVTDTATDMFERVVNKKSSTKKKKSVGKGTGSAENYFIKTLNGRLTSKYGLGYGIGNQFHRGIDIGAEENSPVYSPVDGTVISNKYDPVGYGNHVVVQDENGYNHLFAHLNQRSNLAVGDTVSANDMIGNVGTTGRSTGNHLHYEVRKGFDKYSSVNPNDYAKSVGYGKGKTKSIYEQQMKQTKYEERDMGGSSKNLENENIIKKLNVAVNTDGVENKLDILIDVMKDWATKSEKSSKSIVQATTNIGYGNGSNKSPKTVVVEKPVYVNNDSDTSSGSSNRSIHDLIAKVESYT